MKRRLCALALLALIMAAVAVGCAAQPGEGTPALEEVSASTGEQNVAQDYTAGQGAYTTLENTEKTYIQFEGSAIAISAEGSGTGASVEGSTVTISAGGMYILSGTLEAGQVLVEASKEDTVQLVLNGVHITAEENAAIYGKQVDTLIITLAEGTQNSLVDAANFTYADTEAEEPDAALFCKDDLILNGDGTLLVTAAYNNGIGSKDDLLVEGGSYTVTAASHGIRGRDSLQILDGSFNIEAGSDALQSNNDADADKGYIEITGGDFTLTAGRDGIQAETTLTIHNGAFAITTGGGHANTEIVETESYKGLKAKGAILLEDGSYTIDSADDAIHSNAGITVLAGSYLLQTGDDGMHADESLTIQNGTIQIPACYEGLEAANVAIHGSNIHIVASDDAINAAGGTDGGEGGRFGKDQFGQRADGSYAVQITGGEITLKAGGDGLDSNGNIDMSGGTMLIHGASGGPDSAIDYDGAFTISGGTLLAAGNTQMAQGPGESSTQPSLMIYYTDMQQAGGELVLQAADGSTLASFTPENAFQCVELSTPALELNGTYTVAYGGKSTQVQLTGLLTRMSDTGEAVAGGGMRPGGQGGGEAPSGGGPGRGTRPEGELPEGMTPPEGGIPPGGQPPDGAPEQPGAGNTA